MNDIPVVGTAVIINTNKSQYPVIMVSPQQIDPPFNCS